MDIISDHIEEHILKAVGTRFLQGDTFRMRHTHKTDGIVCTPPDKDPAMVVTRCSNGWVFICHRCHMTGMVSDTRLGPGSTRKRIEDLKKIPAHKMSTKIELPYDMKPMLDLNVDISIPYSAFNHMWKYGFRRSDFKEYDIGWSDTYQRIIIPLYEYSNFGDDMAKKVVGWVGRNPVWQEGDRYPKWMTRSQKDRRRVFMAPGDLHNIVLVEDVLSAINVARSTGFTAIALLTTSIPEWLMKWLRGKTTYLWLDADQLANSVKTVTRMKSLGLEAKHIYTTKDPKSYNKVAVIEILRPSKEGYESGTGTT